MFRRIMVPLDGSAFGEYALPAAATLARRHGGTLELVHVHRHREYLADQEGITPYRYEDVVSLERRLDEDACEVELTRMNELAAEIRATHGLEVTVRLVHDGSAAGSLQRYATANGIDLIVMATHARSGSHSTGAGSVAARLVHEADVPLLLLRPNGELQVQTALPAFRHVLVPLDGSARSEDVLFAVRRLAEPFGSSVTLLQVIEHGVWPMNLLEVQVEDVARKAVAHRYLDGVAGRLAAEWMRPDVAVVTHRSLAQGILQAADELGADTIAMATHGRTGMPRVVMGSVAAEVLYRSRLPVLLFGPAAASRHHRAESRPAALEVAPA